MMRQAVLRMAAIAAAAALAGCAVPRRTYVRQSMAPGELALARTPRGLAFVRQHSAGREALDLDLLEQAVACVPEAQAEMDAVDSLRTTGTVMKWVGWAAVLSGAAVLVASVVKDDFRFVSLGVTLVGSGGLLTETPRYLAPAVTTNAVDAMTAYTDQFRGLPACGGRPPPPPPEGAPGSAPKPGDPGPGGPRL